MLKVMCIVLPSMGVGLATHKPLISQVCFVFLEWNKCFAGLKREPLRVLRLDYDLVSVKS